MSFPVKVTSVLTGASISQLRHWKQTSLLIPEISERPYRYSFRDLVALRTFVKLRSAQPLQRIRKAMLSLEQLDLTDHPSKYHLVASGNTILLVEQNETATDLLIHPGNQLIATMADVFAPFENLQGRTVIDFRRPRPHLEVREKRIGGWPTIEGTRVPFDVVADLLADPALGPRDVARIYPNVGEAAARDALDFATEVRAIKA
jgi:uncharacterized protein (DUF433 family)/DNA-binding transcriptional MerR regulator